MYLNNKELDSVYAAIDFIESNSDFADDQEYFQDIIKNLRSICAKGAKKKAEYKNKKLVKYYLDKLTNENK